MKKLFILFLISTITLSCSSDDSSTTNFSNSDILGTWKITQYQDSQYSNISQVEADEPCFSQATMTYSNNSLLRDFYKYGTNCTNTGYIDKTYEIEGNVLTHTETNGGYEPNTDYVVKYQIQELTATTLKLKGIYVDEGVAGQNPNISNNPFYETWEKVN